MQEKVETEERDSENQDMSKGETLLKGPNRGQTFLAAI